jgi:hypothetical protein
MKTNSFKRPVRIALLLILLMLSIRSFATVVTFSVLDMTGGTNDVTINLKPVNNPVIWNGGFYWLPTGGTNITTTNGLGQINLIPGKYNAVIVGQPVSWALNVTNSAQALPAIGLSSGITYFSGVQGLQGSGGIHVTQISPGIFEIDGSQISRQTGSGSAAPTGALIYDEPGLTITGYLLFN